MKLLKVVIIGVGILFGCSAAFADDIADSDFVVDPDLIPDVAVANLLLDTHSGPVISLDLDDVDLGEVLQILGEILHVNIVTHPEVAGRVNQLRFIDVKADHALEVVLRTHGLHSVLDGNVMVIYPINLYIKNLQERIRLRNIY